MRIEGRSDCCITSKISANTCLRGQFKSLKIEVDPASEALRLSRCRRGPQTALVLGLESFYTSILK